MTTHLSIPSPDPTDSPIPSSSPAHRDPGEERRAPPLALNPALTAEFLETVTSENLSRDGRYDGARAFLLAHSPQLRDITQRIDSWMALNRELATFKQSATEIRISLAADADNHTAKAALSELETSLNEFLTRNQLASRRQSSPREVHTADDLLTKVHRATQRLNRLVKDQSEIVESTVASFFAGAQSRAKERAEALAIREIEQELHHCSHYYPRGASPEAYALQFGLLRMPGGAQGPHSILELYRTVERGSEDLASETSEVAVSAPGVRGSQGYFARLKELKALLRRSPSDSRAGVLKELHTLYSESGSAALVYFSALDRLAVGDLSHETLFAASRAADELRRRPEFIETLRVLTEGGSDPLVLFHLYRALLSEGAREAESSYQALVTSERRAPEQALAAAVRALGRARYPEASDHAMGAYADAKRTRGAEPLALDALRTALTANVRDDGAALLKEKLALKILQRDPEDPFAWDILLSPLLGGESIEWERITPHLLQFRGVEGYLRAAGGAVQEGDLARAEELLGVARELDTRTVRALLASIDFAHHRGDVESAQGYLSLAIERAPHHPELPAWSGHFPLRTESEFTYEEGEPSIPESVPDAPISVRAWSPTIRAQIRAAREMEGVPLLHALRERCEEFAAAYVLLAPQSTLLTGQYESLKQLRAHLAAVRPLRQHRFDEDEWNRTAAGIYQALKPDGFESPVGSYTNLLRELHSVLDSLDPIGEQFATLRHHARVVALARNARDAYVACAETVMARSTPADRLNRLTAFITSLETFEQTLSGVVAPDILHGAHLLERWVAHLEGIPFIELGDTPPRDSAPRPLPDGNAPDGDAALA